MVNPAGLDSPLGSVNSTIKRSQKRTRKIRDSCSEKLLAYKGKSKPRSSTLVAEASGRAPAWVTNKPRPPVKQQRVPRRRGTKIPRERTEE